MPKKSKEKQNRDDDWGDDESEKKLSSLMENLGTGDGEETKKKKSKVGPLIFFEDHQILDRLLFLRK